jgi:hypothetical protein
VLEPGTSFERYEVLRPLGEGGMAKVYLVEHTTLGTLHALKVLQMTGPQLRARFLEEGRTQSELRHENVVRVSDVFEVQGLPAMVLDYVDGPDLLHFITAESPGPELAEQVFRGILAGVQAAHHAGIVHRDLKPANVLMAKGADGRWVPKVADFGLAKVLTGEDVRGFQTRQGHPMGTPRYMAPEQIRDASKADFRSDIFALGAILFELLAHQPAFDGADVVDIFQAIGEGRRAALPATTPPHLARVVEACLATNPVDRPRDVPAIVALLDAGKAAPAPTPVLHAAIPLAMWLGAWAVVVGVGAIAAGALLLAVLAGLSGADPEAPCGPADHVLGVVRAPTVFSRKSGEVWLLREPLQVFESTEAGGPGDAVCRLPIGTRVTLVQDPVVVGRDRWVLVDGARLLAPVAGDPELGEDRGACEGEPGVVLGYVKGRGGALGMNAPRQGGTWTASAGREVYAFVGEPELVPPVVCVLTEPVRFEILEAPTKVGREWWIPFALPAPPP